ncbi:RT0821/Lpp0805 family surface protein [Roseibium aggregatum]|uniref:RT0821/Lpp0805 family surface protein n=1 Tax=Roseibium aggregatum TaxID=187304 RepID=UPI003A97FBCD
MRSYTAGHMKIQPLAALCVALATALGGCSQFSVPMGSNNIDSPTLLTGSIPSASDVAYADINEDDRSVIAQNLDTIGPDLTAGKPTDALSLTWLNSISGNSGTLSSINASTFSETDCLGFKTTANTIVGIKLYSGTACRDVTQKFAVTSLNVADA